MWKSLDYWISQLSKNIKQINLNVVMTNDDYYEIIEKLYQLKDNTWDKDLADDIINKIKKCVKGIEEIK